MFIKQAPIQYHVIKNEDVVSSAQQLSKGKWEFCKVFPFCGKFVVAHGIVNLAEYYQNYIWYVICEKFGFGNPNAFFARVNNDPDTDAKYRDAADMLFCECVWGFVDSTHDTIESAIDRFNEITEGGEDK